MRSEKDPLKLFQHRPANAFSHFLDVETNTKFFLKAGPFKLNLKKRFLRLNTYPLETTRHITALKTLGNRRGYRHRVFLPTRGQATKTNAKTRKNTRKGNNYIVFKKKVKKIIKKRK